MICKDKKELKDKCAQILRMDGNDVQILNEDQFRNHLIDDLIYTAVFSPDEMTRDTARWMIGRSGVALGIISSSIQSLYEAMGREEVGGFTVPAINLRGITYHAACAVFRAMIRGQVGPVIFEIARSEIDYTMQRPLEYACAVIAAAIQSGYKGPVFLQGDHFQINAKKFAADAAKETQVVKNLIWEAMEAGFYNIDIDTSTLVDLSKPTVKEQQKVNYSLAAEFTTMIRDLEPEGIVTSVGGEIGEVGGKNSTVEELRAFMDGYLEELKNMGIPSKESAKSACKREPPTAVFPWRMEPLPRSRLTLMFWKNYRRLPGFSTDWLEPSNMVPPHFPMKRLTDFRQPVRRKFTWLPVSRILSMTVRVFPAI